MSKRLNNKSNKNILLYVIIILSIVLFISISIGSFVLLNKKKQTELLNNPNIYNNISIQGIDVSNMSKDEGFIALKDIFIDEKINLKYNDKEYVFNKIDFGLTLDKEKALKEAYDIGRVGTDKERLKTIKDLENNVKQISISRNINEEICKKKLKEISTNIDIQPQNAKIEKNNNTFLVIDEVSGLKVNIEKTYENLANALKAQGDTNIDIIVEEVKPKYTSKDLNKIQDKLGSFSTKYTNKGGKDTNRITNMKVAAIRINGTILYPGEVFSTNKKFGATTKANGYKPAPTILNGKFIDEYGGGVCQVSSTLYNAVLYSELDIVERQNHSLKVGYLDYGYDATLAGDYIDLKFKNTTNYPIYIEAYLTDNEFICNIYGYDERPKNRKLKLENALIDVIKPSPRVVKETDELLEGEEKVVVKPLNGYKYKLYKLVYVDDKLTEKVLVNNSYYKPRAEEVLVGTKKVVDVAKTDQKPVINNTSNINEVSTEIITEEVIKEEIIDNKIDPEEVTTEEIIVE